jgi:hypothetical protein
MNMSDTVVDENEAGTPKRRSSLSLLEISNLRQLWSMRRSSITPNHNPGFMHGEVLPSLKNYSHRLSISGQGMSKNLS